MIIDSHCHPFGPVSHADLSDKVRTVEDLIAFRRNYPELYQERHTANMIDYMDAIIADMDQYGVDKAVVMPTFCSELSDTKNEKTVEAIKKHPARLFGLMHLGWDESVAAGVDDDPIPEREAAPALIDRWIGEHGLRGIAESHGGPFTTEIHPVKIAEDLRPIMETVAKYNVPVLFATGWTQFPGRMYHADPIYVDEIAGRYPDVPIVLTKMGRGIAHYFESALIVAMRNPNVYFDTTYSNGDHIRRAVRTIGADRMMFGSDWAVVWRWVREPEDLYSARLRAVRESGISMAEQAQILGKTAEKLFRV